MLCGASIIFNEEKRREEKRREEKRREEKRSWLAFPLSVLSLPTDILPYDAAAPFGFNVRT